jgi:hypothetical protein
MNSREAAYDEDEQLRRAIEESKELASHQEDTSSRRGKRGRSDSEEYVYPTSHHVNGGILTGVVQKHHRRQEATNKFTIGITLCRQA